MNSYEKAIALGYHYGYLFAASRVPDSPPSSLVRECNEVKSMFVGIDDVPVFEEWFDKGFNVQTALRNNPDENPTFIILSMI